MENNEGEGVNSGHPTERSSGNILLQHFESADQNDASTQAASDDHHADEVVGLEVTQIDLADATSFECSRPRLGSRIGNMYHMTSKKGIVRVDSAHPEPGSVAEVTEVEATWGDVYVACCYHSGKEWLLVGGFFAILLLMLYFFLVGLDLLGTSFQVVGGCTAGSLLGSDVNPFASVMIGIIATAILQSSSTTTSIVVSLVSGGLDVKQGIYMVMGANVGTTITSMLVSLAHASNGEELERAFAASSQYFLFNFLTTVILMPLEITTAYLYEFTKIMLPTTVSEGESWEGPIKKIVSPFTKSLIVANKGLIEGISVGEYTSCDQFYPVQCEGGIESYETCKNTAGLIACNEKTNECPAFFEIGATKKEDMVSGWVCMLLALFLLILSLVGLVALLRKVLLGASQRIIYKATSMPDLLAMAIGTGVTVLVQSSSITTSSLVPLAGVGVLSLDKMYPLVLGADIGTTVSALLAAMVSSKVQSLQIALVHLFFNVTGILIWYPIPYMRNIVFRMARALGMATREWRAFPMIFIPVVFLLVPLLLLGISTCFEKGSKGFTALGVFILLIVVGVVLYMWVWWRFRDGKASFKKGIERRRRQAAAQKALADDMDYLKVDLEWCKNEIGRLKDFAGMAIQRLEEGRQQEIEQIFQPLTGDDDQVSLYGSAKEAPWRNVLYSAVGSIRSELTGSTR